MNPAYFITGTDTDVGKTTAYMEATTAESVAKDSFGH